MRQGGRNFCCGGPSSDATCSMALALWADWSAGAWLRPALPPRPVSSEAALMCTGG